MHPAKTHLSSDIGASKMIINQPDTEGTVFVPKRNILNYWKSFNVQKKTKRQFATDRSHGPMARLWRAMQTAEHVVVMTRGLREPRASLTGKLVAFDRFWNLILSHVTEYSVQLKSSDLTGYSKPGRSQKRRRQRQARALRCFNAIYASPQLPPLEDEPPIDEALQSTSRPLTLNEMSDMDLIWGGGSPPSIQSSSNRPAYTGTTDIISHPAISIGDTLVTNPSATRDTATQVCGLTEQSTKSSGWTPSLTQLCVKNQMRSFSSKGQLFIRGANIISVVFPGQ